MDIQNKLLTVQAGITWREIQKFINPHGLSVKSMQSYKYFSVGGSLSVNVHGQDIHFCPMISSIESLKILCADGSIKNVNRTENSEFFKLIIGGYGLFGIVIEATLSLISIVEEQNKNRSNTAEILKKLSLRKKNSIICRN